MITTNPKRAGGLAATSVLALLLGACASGGGSFSCPYEDAGFGCQSTPAIYDRTNSVQSPQLAITDTPAWTAGNDRRSRRASPRATPANLHAAAVRGDALSLAAPVQDGMGAFHNSALSLGSIQTSAVTPDAVARMPAQVMRIWVSPWIDEAGDLHRPGHIYTEIVTRRWAVGGDVREPDGALSFDPNGAMYPTN